MELCYPSPCGPNSQCKIVNNQVVCSCLLEYVGSPPNCRPECVTSSECTHDKACVKNKCINPCPKPCGVNTICKIINHSPICSCKTSFTGDPFTICTPIKCKYKYNYTFSHDFKNIMCYPWLNNYNKLSFADDLLV